MLRTIDTYGPIDPHLTPIHPHPEHTHTGLHLHVGLETGDLVHEHGEGAGAIGDVHVEMDASTAVHETAFDHLTHEDDG